MNRNEGTKGTYHDGAFVAVGSVHVTELLKGVGADDIAVEDEERAVVLAQDMRGQGERTSCCAKLSGQLCRRMKAKTQRTSVERLVLDRESDFDAILLLELAEKADHDFRAIVDGKNNIFDTGLRQHKNVH